MRLSGERVKELRSAKGLTRAHLASYLGCAPTTIYSMELGKYKTTKLLPKLCKHLGCEESDIMCLEDELVYCKYNNCSAELDSSYKHYCDEHKKQVNRDTVNLHNKQRRKKTISQLIPNYENETISEGVGTGRIIKVHAEVYQGGVYEGDLPILSAKDPAQKDREYYGFYDCTTHI